MPDAPREAAPLSVGTESFVASVLNGASATGLSLWLRAAAERFGLMVESMVPALTARDLIHRLSTEITAGNTGPMLERATAVELAGKEAALASRAVVAERDLVAAPPTGFRRTSCARSRGAISRPGSSSSGTPPWCPGSRVYGMQGGTAIGWNSSPITN